MEFLLAILGLDENDPLGKIPLLEFPTLFNEHRTSHKDLPLSKREAGFRNIYYTMYKLWNGTKEGESCYDIKLSV